MSGEYEVDKMIRKKIKWILLKYNNCHSEVLHCYYQDYNRYLFLVEFVLMYFLVTLT